MDARSAQVQQQLKEREAEINRLQRELTVSIIGASLSEPHTSVTALCTHHFTLQLQTGVKTMQG